MQSINIDTNKGKKITIEKIKESVKDTIDAFKHEYRGVGIMILVALVLMIALLITSKVFKSSESDAMIAYSKFQNSLLASKSDVATNKRHTVIIPSDTAVDTEKLTSDMDKAESYIRTWFNWQNGEEYNEARKSVINTFGKKSVMAKQFIKNVEVESNGKTVNLVDNEGLNMSILDMKTYPISFKENGESKYISMISFETRSDKNVNTTATMMLYYTFDQGGFITDARAYALSNL